MEGVEAATREEVLEVLAIRRHRLVEGLGFLQDPVGPVDLEQVMKQGLEVLRPLLQGLRRVEDRGAVKKVVEVLH